MAIARAIGFKTRTLITLGLVLSLFATGLIVLRSAAAAGTPLLAIGADVVSADLKTATYEITVRNDGTADADDVRVTLTIPTNTTFESSTPPAAPVDGGVTPTCDNGGTREPQATSCQWAVGLMGPGTSDTTTVVLNILPSAATITFSPEVTGKNTAGANINKQSDPDASLTRRVLPVSGGQDTFVNRSEPANTNHGQCQVLTTRGNGTSTAYIDLASTAFTTGTGAIEKVWGAQLEASVAASDYGASSPGVLALHAITSGDWTEGGTANVPNCSLGTPGSGSDVRTGSEPAVRGTATATQSVTGTGLVSWEITEDIDGAAERAAFQGWEIRNTTGSGSLDLHSGEAVDSSTPPRVAVVYTTPETGRCIDVDPESQTAHPSSEQVLSATVTDGGARVLAAGIDACNGTPVSGQGVKWEVERDSTPDPDIYISNQAGTPVPKSGTTDAMPELLQTTTDALGATFIGVRLANPQTFNGENRVSGFATGAGTDPGEPPPDRTTCDLDNSCPTGEDSPPRIEDDVRLQWSATFTPPPSETPTPRPSPPTVTSFSPTSGPIGTQVTVNGTNFTGTTAVRFNGTSAGFSVNSTNQITTSVPTGATDGPISVQNPAGTRLSASNFDVVPRPASSSPSPTNSVSPETSPTPGSTASPSGLSPVTLALTSSTEQTVAFTELTLSGALNAENPVCAQPGTTIEIRKREAESTSYGHLAYVTTGVGGLFEHKVTPDANTFYVASIGEHGPCAAAGSPEIVILVSPKVSIKSTAKTVEAGKRFWITGSVLPEHQLTLVTIWRKTGPGEWDKVSKDYLDGGSRYSLSLRYIWKRKEAIFETRWKADDADHISGESTRLRIERLILE